MFKMVVSGDLNEVVLSSFASPWETIGQWESFWMYFSGNDIQIQYTEPSISVIMSLLLNRFLLVIINARLVMLWSAFVMWIFGFFKVLLPQERRKTHTCMHASLPFLRSGTHVVLQVGAPHPVPPHATEQGDGPWRLPVQPASQAAARSAAL